MKIKGNNQKPIEEKLVDLYIDLKTKENVSTNIYKIQMNIFSEENLIKEKKKLNSMNSFIVIEYIKSTIDILVDFKVNKQIESFFNNFNENKENSDYSQNEDLLRKSEADIRNRIKIHHQMIIYADNLKLKFEEMEKSKNEYKKSFFMLQEVN